jgi:hypothetical protein
VSKTSDEALARIEHKVDVTLDLVMEMLGRLHLPIHIPKMRDESHTCPVCKEYVKYVVDMQDRSVTAQCGCKTGKFAPLDLERFAPPLAAGGKDAQREGSRHNSADEGDGSGELGSSPNSRRR